MARNREARVPGGSAAVRVAAFALATSALAVLAGCGGSSPTPSSSVLPVTVSSTTKAQFTGVTCALDPSGTVVTARGIVANNGAGNLRLVLDVHDSSGKTIVLPGSHDSRTISATAITFKVPVHLSRDTTPANCTLDVSPG